LRPAAPLYKKSGHLDRAPLVHRFVALGGLRERQLGVEDLARVDLPTQIRSISSGRLRELARRRSDSALSRSIS
jgi:hypothetical protein